MHRGTKLSLDNFFEGKLKENLNKDKESGLKVQKKSKIFPNSAEKQQLKYKWNIKWFLDFSKEELYGLLVQAVQKSPLFLNYVAWTSKTLHTEDLDPQEIASRLDISLGEARIILDTIFQQSTNEG